MLKRLLVVVFSTLLCLVTSSDLLAQANVRNFFLYGIDTTNFPRTTAYVFAADAAYNRYNNLSVTDFDLFENGQQKDATLTLNCDTSATPLPVAVCLTLDQSFSMATKTSAGDTYWDWVKFGAKSFIDTLKMIPPTCVAITSFGGTAFTRAPFQTTKPPLYAALDQIPIEGGTNYDEAFLNTSNPAGANGAVCVLRNAPQGLRRFMIILTDGQPDKPPAKQRIIDSCLANGITVFAINIATPKSQTINNDLNEIATKTNGRAFLARTKADMGAIYRLIALEIQRNVDCRLTWTSDPGCTQKSRTRTLAAVFRKNAVTLNWNGSYVASFNSLANPITSVSTLSFSDPGTGNKQRKTVTIKTPPAIAIRVTGITSGQPGLFDIISTSRPIPFTLNPGESADVVVEFTQTTTGSLHSSLMTIKGGLCNQTVVLNVIIPVLKLESPTTGQSYVACDSVPIRWSGIAEDEAITIMSSSDNGSHWGVIENDAVGLNFAWKNRVEHDAGTQNPFPYRVKVQRSSCRWLLGIGGLSDDTARSIAYNPTTRLLAVGGSYKAQLNFNASPHSSAGGEDGFLATMDQNGVSKFFVSCGGTADDEIVSVDVDSSAQYIIGGNTHSSKIQCGDSLLLLGQNKASCAFVSAIDSLGKTRWVVAIGDTSGTNTGEMVLTSVHVKADSSIAVQGYMRGIISAAYMRSSKNVALSFDAPNLANLMFPVTVDLSKDGKVVRYLSGFFYPSYQIAKTTALVNNNSYQVGTFSSSMRCGQITTTAMGGSDAFVRAVSLNPGTDQSGVFKISAPLAMFEVDQLSIPSVDVGTNRNFYVGQPLRSAGSMPLNLSQLFPVGIDSLDFSVVPPLAPGVIGAFSSPQIWITYAPNPVSRRQRFAYLVAESECADPAYIRIYSYATFPNLMMNDHAFGRKRLGTINVDTLFITNNDAGATPINNLTSRYNTNGQFQWRAIVASDSLVPGKTRVPVIVSFTPSRIESDSLEVRVDSSAAVPIPVHGLATGSGFLPRETSRGYGFAAVPIRQLSSEIGEIFITNSDTIAPLRVYSCTWRNNQSDAFSAGRIVPDTSIAPGDSIRIPIRYQPMSAGNHQAFFVFEHDAGPGPNLAPRLYDTVRVFGEAIDVSLDKQSITFQPILRCDSSSSTVTITNHASGADVHVSQVVQSGDVQDFSYDPPAPFTIAAGASKTVRIMYNPHSATTTSSQLVFIHDGGDPDTVQMSGTAVIATLNLHQTDTSFWAKIDSKHVIPVYGSLSSSTPFALDTITFAVHTNPSQAGILFSEFNTTQGGWTWSYDALGSDYFFHGTYKGGPQQNPVLFMNLPLKIYLSPIFVNTMTVHAIADYAQACFVHDTATIVINEIPVCFINGAGVHLGTPMNMVLQQHSDRELDVVYTLPFTVPARCEIFDVLGTRVLDVAAPQAREGENVARFDLRSLGQGTYFCKVSAESAVSIQQFRIVR